jgi:hypothetical protein
MRREPMDNWKWYLVAGISLLLGGCYSTGDYRDPQAIGRVPVEAKSCGVGCAGDGTRLTLGTQAKEAGEFIVVAGDTPILRQRVGANDMVWVNVNHRFLGKCHIEIVVNNVVTQKADSGVAVYRGYFLAGNGA